MTDPLLTVPTPARAGVWLVVDFFVKSDRIEDARALFARHVANGRGDAGNLMFIALENADDPTRFTTVEAWAAASDIDAHDQTDHHARFLEQLRVLQAREKQVRTHRYLPAARADDVGA